MFRESHALSVIAGFALGFGVLLDLGILLGKRRDLPQEHRRTMFQEPPGLVIFGVPAALLLSRLNPDFFLMSIIPFGLHITQDYMTRHEVMPFAPLGRKKYRTGFIRPAPAPVWAGRGGISENYMLLLNIALCFFLV